MVCRQFMESLWSLSIVAYGNQTALHEIVTPYTPDDHPIADSHIELERRIRERAYQIYRARNGEPGNAVDDWLQAEREILGAAKQPAQDRGTVVGPAGVPRIV